MCEKNKGGGGGGGGTCRRAGLLPIFKLLGHDTADCIMTQQG